MRSRMVSRLQLSNFTGNVSNNLGEGSTNCTEREFKGAQTAQKRSRTGMHKTLCAPARDLADLTADSFDQSPLTAATKD